MSYDDSADIDSDNHKLVIVLDHSPYFTSSSDPNKWLDSFCKDAIPIIPKSLWACLVESTMEFTRIVWNIYPKDKLIRVVVGNYMAHILNSWNEDTQSSQYLSEALATIGPPTVEMPEGQDASILHGLRGALESLVVYTPLQRVKFFDDLACMAKTQYAKLNRGRIICITSLSTDTDLKILTNVFANELGKYNYNASHSNFEQLPVTHCHLILINVYPTDTTCDIVDQPPHQVTTDLTIELHVVDAIHLSDKLAQLLVLEYNLASTVIDEIPSRNYNKNDRLYEAEMFHSRDVHLDIIQQYPDTVRDVRIQGNFYTKMRLHWSYQDFEVTDIITSITRITPADVKSPGAIRLIKHIYKGKKVLLEFPTKNGIVIKYMIAVQNGDIFLHTLMVPREVPIILPENTEAPEDDGDAQPKCNNNDAVKDANISDTISKNSDTETAVGSDSTFKSSHANTDTNETSCDGTSNDEASDEKATSNDETSDCKTTSNDEISDGKSTSNDETSDGKTTFNNEKSDDKTTSNDEKPNGKTTSNDETADDETCSDETGSDDICTDETCFYEVSGDEDDSPIVRSENDADENVVPFKRSILYSPHVKKLLFNLLTIFVRFRLTGEQINMCCTAIGQMKSKEMNLSFLNLQRDNFYKNFTRSKQYEILWSEVQIFLEDNLFSTDHEIVYNYFREVVRSDSKKFETNKGSRRSAPKESVNEEKEIDAAAFTPDPIEETTKHLSLLEFLVGKADEKKDNEKDANKNKSNKKDSGNRGKQNKK